MPGNATAEIVVAGTGKVLVAPVGTVAPVDHSEAWAAAWIDLGFTTEDGVTFNPEMDLSEIMVWQSFYAARRIVTSRTVTAAFQLRQWNKNNVPLAFGGGTVVNVAASAGPPAVLQHYKYTPPAPETIDERALGLEWKDGTKVYRLIIPKGMVSESPETNLVRTDSAVLPITFGVNASDTGDPWYIRTNDPAFA